MPLVPTPSQLRLLLTQAPETLYTGAWGSGKSTALLMAAIAEASAGGAALVVVPELCRSSVPSWLRDWLGATAKPQPRSRSWGLAGGGRIVLAHRRERPSGVFGLVCVDDLCRYHEEEYSEWLGCGLRLMAAATPEEPGREWVAARFGLKEGQGSKDRVVIAASLEEIPGGKEVERQLRRLPEPRRSDALGSWRRPEPEPQSPVVVGLVPPLRFPTPHDGGGDRDGIRVLLGKSASGREIWWEPTALSNPHLAVSGETGSGKTQSLMALASELHRQRTAVLVFDFKDDYATTFAATEAVEVWDPSERGLPFNPLAPTVDAEGRLQPLAHVHRVADVVKRVWGLGDQQASRLREALKQLYVDAGIPLSAHQDPAGRRWPRFGELAGLLEPNDTLRGRLSQVFDLRLLDPGPEDDGGFARLVDSGGIVRLARLPGDEAKSAVAELLLLALYGELVRRPHLRRLRAALVLDEGWRLSTCPYLEPLLREGRAFGLACILASQFPRDLPPAVRGSCATQLFFAQTDAAQATEVARSVLGEAHSAQAVLLSRQVRALPQFVALLLRRESTTGRAPTLRVTPWFERRGLGEQPGPQVRELTPQAFNPGLGQ